MDKSDLYSQKFYEGIRDGSLASARAVVPIVLDLVPAKSVCDIGCGVGTWLHAFSEAGISDFRGFDGSYVDPNFLQIPRENFTPTDLSKSFSAGRTFDLACSLEVAEHIPEASTAGFLDSLTRLAPVILFSAAIPFQGGQGHYNEQWPSYWIKLFAARGYTAIDCLRSKIWDNPEIERWYCQNIFIFAKPEAISHFPKLATEYRTAPREPSDIVHPREYLLKAGAEDYFTGTAKKLPKLFLQALRRRRHGSKANRP